MLKKHTPFAVATFILSLGLGACQAHFVAGPEVVLDTATSTTITWQTDRATSGQVYLDDQLVADDNPSAEHTIKLESLEPDTVHNLSVIASDARYDVPLVIPENLALILAPHTDWLSGEVELRAEPAVPG